jgi:hypothetical protein
MFELDRPLYANRTGRDTSGFGRRRLSGQAVRDNERRQRRQPVEQPRREADEPEHQPEGKDRLPEFPRLEQALRRRR